MSNEPDFDQARLYALGRLEHELHPQLYYHSLAHTRDEVAPAAERLAASEGVSGEDLLLLRTAAYFHDLGYIERRTKHESTSVRIASQVLPSFGYKPEQIERIRAMIMATELPQSTHNLLEDILVDADLDVLGKDDFLPRSLDLQAELAAFGSPTTEVQWFNRQKNFLLSHHYRTKSAQEQRDEGKRKNVEELNRLLDLYKTQAA